MNYRINITIRLFNVLRDISGKSSINVSLPEGATADDILSKIKAEHRQLSDFIFDKTGELKTYIKLFRSMPPPPTEENISDRIYDGETFDLFVVSTGG